MTIRDSYSGPGKRQGGRLCSCLICPTSGETALQVAGGAGSGCRCKRSPVKSAHVATTLLVPSRRFGLRRFAGRLFLSYLNPQITFSRTDMKRITFVKSKVSAVAPGRMQFEIGTAVEQTSNKEPGLYGSAPANAASQLTRYTEVRTCNDF